MIVSDAWPLAYEFACHSASCAPPPAGKGGSDRGDSGHASHQRDADAMTDEERRAKRRFEAGHAFETQPGKYRKPMRAGGGGSLPGTHGGDHKAAYVAMKKREAAQARVAQTNRARANYGMPPLRG